MKEKLSVATLAIALTVAFAMAPGATAAPSVKADIGTPSISTEGVHTYVTESAACEDFCAQCALVALLVCSVLGGGFPSDFKCGPDPNTDPPTCTCTFTCVAPELDAVIRAPHN